MDLEKDTEKEKQEQIKLYGLNKNKYLLTPEIEELEDTLKEYEEMYPRDTLLIYVALKTGARAKEILNIKYSDINEFDQTIFLKGIKNSNDRELPLSPRLFKKLMKYVRVSRGKSEQQLFDISYNRFRQIWEHYRPVNKKLHALRHTFAIELYKKTKDLRLVQLALGHRSITNTMIYANYIYSQKELKKLIL